MWIDSADDFVNPPDLKIAKREIEKVKNVICFYSGQ